MEGAVQHFGVKGDGKLELEIKPFAAFNEKTCDCCFLMQSVKKVER